MSTLIRDLVHFEEVEEVIKIRKEDKAKEYVEKYVISDSLRSNLAYMLEILSGATHKSFNVVGNYGTGKSHFLAFVGALLEHPEYRSLVADPTIASKAQELTRRYLVVKFELGAAKEISLRHIFFDQIRRQLLERYEVEVRHIDLTSAYDNKQNIMDILNDVKNRDPEAGLVVIVDEISDFLKQKSKEDMSYDLALLRELGEVSQDSDFLYIGAMQEHVFTNAKYVDQAESIARINQRFVTVTITKDDVSQVLTNRVVRKDADQRIQLEALLSEYRQYFPNLAHQTDRYINLFPIHPYVIDVFEQLPYFENRGIIGFAVQNVQPILEQPAPVFITYDRVFDLINTTHEIRNQPSVARIVNVIQKLEPKIDLLDGRYREDARKLIKALAVLRLLGGEKVNGATAQELANTLFIVPPGQKMLVTPELAQGNIERIMKNIRDVTVGQFIEYGEGRYYLEPEKIDDYDALIEQKAQAAVINNPGEIEATFREYVLTELGLRSQAPYLAGKPIYWDTTQWISHRSFRSGLLIIGRGDDGAGIQHGDYRFIIQGPAPLKTLGLQNELVLSVDLPNEVMGSIVRSRAAELLALENVHKKIMTQISKDALKLFGEKYLALLMQSGVAIHGGHKVELSKIPSSKPLNALSDIVEHVKGKVFDTIFTDKYPNHPVFNTLITAANISGEMSRALQSLERQTMVQLDLNSRGYLESFGAMKEGHFSASNSLACKLILDRIEANDKVGKVTPLEDLLKEFEQKPWGLPAEMVYLLLGSLLFNGYVIFVRHGGVRLHANDVSPLVKQGLDFFKDIRYLERDKDIDVEAVVNIFNALGLQAGLVRDKDSRSEAVKVLHQRGVELKETVAALRQGMQTTVADAANYPDIPWLVIQESLSHLAHLDKPLATFADAMKVADLGKLDTSPEFLQQLKTSLVNLETLNSFLQDWREGGLSAGLLRMQQGLSILPGLIELVDTSGKSTISDLERVAADSKVIYSDTKQFLSSEFRRPLKGKLEQFRQKYDQLYYGLHQKHVGDKAPWGDLAKIRQSSRFVALNQLKGLPFISSSPFNQVALEMQSLERKRCNEFNAQVLETFAICPYCRFPEDHTHTMDLAGRIQDIRNKLDELWSSWENQIFNEIPNLKERLSLLSTQHRQLIDNLLKSGHLPEVISDDLLSALYELSSDLQPIELDIKQLGEYLLSKGGAMNEEELRTSINDYLDQIIKGYDHDLVRIKIKIG